MRLLKQKTKLKPEWIIMGERLTAAGITHQRAAHVVIEARVTAVTERTIVNWMRGVGRGPDIGQWRLIKPVLARMVGR